MITFDSSSLLGYYLSKAGVNANGGAATPGAGAAAKKLPTPPWDLKAKVPRANDLVKQVMSGGAFVNEGAAKLDVPGASHDYQKMFALYQALNTLSGLAERYASASTPAAEKARVQSLFSTGLAQTLGYLNGMKLDQLRLTEGAAIDKAAKSTVGVKRENDNYQTGVVHVGGPDDAVKAFQGDVKFDISVQRSKSNAVQVPIDLSEMGSTPRTMANVVNFINDKLKAAGVDTRFATVRTQAEPKVVKVGSKTVTLPAGPDEWSLKVKGSAIEKVSFSAPASTPAIYLSQRVGAISTAVKNGVSATTGSTAQQLLKFQVGDLPAGSSAPAAKPGEANWVDGRVFSTTLGKEVTATRATVTGPDGSVYMLADVSSSNNGQPIKGKGDVALLKYDSAGTLVYSRTLGAADTANGYALAVSPDGKVAVAGSVKGALQGAVEGALNSDPGSGKTDSFVTLYDAHGDEVWTERRGAREDDQVNSVAFGADGTVYVAGQTKSPMPGGGGQIGGWDGYLEGFGTTASGAPTVKFTTQFGGYGDDKPAGVAISGNTLVVAGVENGRGVVRQFTLQPSGPPTPAGVRDLGDLQGGSIAGVAFNGADIVVAGSTRNGALSAGSVNTAHSGGVDAFVAKLSTGLGPQASDRLTYFGGQGDDGASALTVSGGQVWIAGSSASTDPSKPDAKDGYVAQIDPQTGAVGWTRRFTAQDGQAAPTSIAVDPNGSSVLDRLGLPKGTLSYQDSTLLTSATSVRAGDQFLVRTSPGARPAAVTIAADDTLATLAVKVQRAAGFQVKVSVVTDKDTNTSRLQIEPMNAKSTVEIMAGAPGKNALTALGLTEGVVRTVATNSKGKVDPNQAKVYGLNLPPNMALDSKDGANAINTALQAALSTIRTAYQDLDAKLHPKPATPTGKAPAYLTAQIKNYQAGLARLNGGG